MYHRLFNHLSFERHLGCFPFWISQKELLWTAATRTVCGRVFISLGWCLSLCRLLQPSITDQAAHKQQECISHHSGGWKSRIRAQHNHVLTKALFWFIARTFLQKGQGPSGVPVRRVLVPFTRTPPHDLVTPKAPPPSIITLAIGISTYEFCVDTNIQSIADKDPAVWSVAYTKIACFILN